MTINKNVILHSLQYSLEFSFIKAKAPLVRYAFTHKVCLHIASLPKYSIIHQL